MSDISNWRDRSILKEYYIEKGWSTKEIAEAADTSPALVADYLSRRNLLRDVETVHQTRDTENTEDTHFCPECDEEFDNMENWSDHHLEAHFLG
ncbi:helix-turn-helix transcriptional regulator [Halorientalis sp. IM1011]|uniref:helix-turn-helix domain-containing protein n=1 Tax=Halorientalis sp. IM1011 TaxID=1932360 RepID=UPI0012F83A56|nr:helix-turn-helix transcriptional regulator [Halorientalis sp. IM1011]